MQMKRWIILLTALVLLFGAFSARADLLPGEPSSTGEGKLTREQFLRLMKFISDGYAEGMLYEEVAAFIGVEGLDKGNTGPNSMTALGDHNFQWVVAEDPKTSVLVCFRGREETGRFEYCQWTAANVDRNEWKDVDLSDWLKAAAAGVGTVPVTMVIQRFSFNPPVTVTAEMPSEGWEVKRSGDNTAEFAQQLGQPYDYPTISVKVYENAEMFDFYLDKYSKIEDIGTRVIAGAPFAGRTYTWEGRAKDYTEYNLMLSEHVGIQIQVDRIDLSDDMPGGKLLNSLAFSFTEKDGTDYVFSAASGTAPAVTAAAAEPEPTPKPTSKPKSKSTPKPTDQPAPAPNAARGGDAHGLAGRKFVAVTYIAGDLTMDAAMLGGEYAILLKEDGTAEFTMAGTTVPGYTWRAEDDRIVVCAYDYDLMVISAEDENTILLEYSGTFTLKMVGEPAP